MQFLHISTVPLYPWFHILRFNNCGPCITIVFTIEKNPCISGLAQFKAMSFKGQLYNLDNSGK